MEFSQLVAACVKFCNMMIQGRFCERISYLESRDAALTEQARNHDDRIRDIESTPYPFGQSAGSAIVGGLVCPQGLDVVVSTSIAGRVEIVGVAPLFLANPPDNSGARPHVTSFEREVINENTYIRFYISGSTTGGNYWLKYQFVYS